MLQIHFAEGPKREPGTEQTKEPDKYIPPPGSFDQVAERFLTGMDCLLEQEQVDPNLATHQAIISTAMRSVVQVFKGSPESMRPYQSQTVLLGELHRLEQSRREIEALKELGEDVGGEEGRIQLQLDALNLLLRFGQALSSDDNGPESYGQAILASLPQVSSSSV